MNERIEQIIQTIGNELLDFLGDDVTDVLVYCEAENGVSSENVVFRESTSGKLIYKFGSENLSDLFYTLWEEWSLEEGPWRAAEYTLFQGKFNLDVIYQDQFDESEDPIERRSAAIRRHFGNEPVDYACPE